MLYNNEREAQDFLRDAVRSAQPMRFAVGRQIGVNRCMFSGAHWITDAMIASFSTIAGRYVSNFNPDSNKLRIVRNRIPRFIHEVAAATFVDKMEMDVSPPDRDAGPASAFEASVLESALGEMLKLTGFVSAARQCSFRRCIDGFHGIGLTVRNEQVGGESDQIVKAFTFDAHRLVLDPHNQSLDLWDHDYVVYRDVWTLQKIKREFNIELDKNKCRTVGELMPIEFDMNQVSQNRLYSNIREYSETKGAVVTQIHVKSDAGMWPTMLISVDEGDVEQPRWVNFDNQETPFGGSGLPFMLLHAHRQPESMASRSDVSLLKDDQDQVNLYSTMIARVLQKYSGFQWLVAKGSMAGDGPDDFKNQFNNYVGGVIEYDPGRKESPKAPPQLVQYPAPQGFLQDAISIYQERDMPSQIHRAPVTAGATKSHVPDATFQAALQQAGQVLGTRIREDGERYERFAGVLLGTCIKLAKAGSPSILMSLRKAGFGDEDFAVLAQADETYPACSITLRESSIRYRSPEQKKQALDTAMQLQALGPEEYRKAMADLDESVTPEDRFYDLAAKKAAMRVLFGEQWIPRYLGGATSFFVNEFQRAALDPRADPESIERLTIAIESMLVNANIQQQMVTPQEGAAPAQPAAQPAEQQMPQQVSVVDLLNQIESGLGTGGSGHPVAA